MRIIDGVVGITAEKFQLDAISEVGLGIQVSIEMSRFLIIVHPQQPVGVVDPHRLGYLIKPAFGISPVGNSGVESRCRIEQFARERNLCCLPEASENSDVECDAVVKSLLCHVKFGDVVAMMVGAHHRPMVHESCGDTIVAALRSASERHMVVLHESLPEDGLVVIGGPSTVIKPQVHLTGDLTIGISGEHVESFVHRLDTDISVI